MSRISTYFNLEEFLVSQTAARWGIDMTPTATVKIALTALAMTVLDPLRQRAGKPIIVTSGYRPHALNARIGGASSSQHCVGEAADIHIQHMSPYTLAQMIIAAKLPFDQLILEFGQWVHVSHKPAGPQRGEVLTAKRIDGKAIYTPGLHQ